MSARTTVKHAAQFACITTTLWMLSACFQPPFNDFKPNAFDFGDPNVCDSPVAHSRAERNTIARATIRQMGRQAIQFVQRGDRMTLIVPTDRYYLFNSPKLDELEYPGLNNISKLLELFPCSRIIVAAFSDNVGKTILNDKLTEARAESMLTFLWAKGIPAQLLKAESFGERFPVGDNHLIHGSAYNRRIEIQWWTGKTAPPPPPIPEHMMTK